MTSPTPSQLSPDDIRRAPSYPRMLTAARVYAAGLTALPLTALLVMLTGVQTWTYVVITVGFLTLMSGAVLARGAFRELERELGANPRSAAVIASAQDILHPRRAGS